MDRRKTPNRFEKYPEFILVFLEENKYTQAGCARPKAAAHTG